MRPRAVLRCGLATGVLVLTACQGHTPTSNSHGFSENQPRLLWSSAHCGVEQAGARWVADRSAIETIVERASSRQLDAEPVEPPAVDLARERVLLLARGRKPTPGYGIGLAESPLELEDGRARMSIRLQQPDPDRIQAQMITTPCALVALPRGDYRQVQVIDRHGAVWESLAVGSASSGTFVAGPAGVALPGAPRTEGS